MTTALDLVVGAYGQSAKNQPGRIATEGTELLRVVNAVMKGAYAIAARVNPCYFGKSAAVAFASGGWPYPADAESVFRIETVTPAEVVVVPFEDRKAEIGRPAVYLFGGQYVGAGNALDPTAGSLTFYYARRHSTLATIGASLDATWPTDYDNLPILAIATYLARKDGRSEEAQGLLADVLQWVSLFVAHVEHAQAETRHRFGIARYANAGSIVSLAQLVVGGAVIGGPAGGGAS